MSVRPEFLVRGGDGRPLPPADLLARIQAREPRIGLFYTNASWAITEAWKADDPRRAWIQENAMPPEMAFDVCGYLPITCSVDEAPAYIERELKNCTADQFNALRQTVNRWNETVQTDLEEQTVMAAVSNDLDKSNIVSPGISSAVAIDLSPAVPIDRMAKARAAKALKNAKAG